MYYCNVVNNEILEGPILLPEGITQENAIVSGWYPTVFLNMPHQLECNAFLQLIEMQKRIVGTTVECWYEVINKTADQLEYSRLINLQVIRRDRNNLLKLTDWTQLPTAPLTEEQKIEWENYRIALRNFPDVVDLSNVIWPVPPAEIEP